MKSDISHNRGIHTHEIFFGRSGRQISIKYNLQVRLSLSEHESSHGRRHSDRDNNRLEGRSQKVIARYFVWILRSTGRDIDYHLANRAINCYQLPESKKYLENTLL